jgi:preprotein translocase subunit SecG
MYSNHLKRETASAVFLFFIIGILMEYFNRKGRKGMEKTMFSSSK